VSIGVLLCMEGVQRAYIGVGGLGGLRRQGQWLEGCGRDPSTARERSGDTCSCRSKGGARAKAPIGHEACGPDYCRGGRPHDNKA